MEIGEEQNAGLSQIEYDRLVEPYRQAMSIIILKLKTLNNDLKLERYDYPIHNIQDRIKSKKSLEKKAASRGILLDTEEIRNQLTDIAGIRVICYSVEDVYRVSGLIRKINDSVEIKSTDYIKYPKKNGYKSFHMVIGVPVYHLDGIEYYPVEIQLRTLGMDFWASMEHRYCYKNEKCAETSRIWSDYRKFSDDIQYMENMMKI